MAKNITMTKITNNNLNNLSQSNGIILNSIYDIDSPEFVDHTDKIFQKYVQFIKSNGKRSTSKAGKRISLIKHHDAMNIVLSCLYREFLLASLSPTHCVRYYQSHSKYVGQPVSFRTYEKIIDWLIQNNYIINYVGGYNRTTKSGKTSRMRWSQKLYKSFYRLDPSRIDIFKNQPLINVRDNNKTNLYDDVALKLFDTLRSNNPYISDLDEHIKINTVRQNTNITLDDKYFALFPLRRVFNNSMFCDGGRFYGSQEQSLDKDSRSRLRINNNSVVELDYSSLHIKMIYDLKQVNFIGEAYEVLDKDNNLYESPIIKIAIMMLINAKNENSARLAIQDKINQDYQHTNYNAQEIINALTTYHSAISDYFGSGAGVKLQRTDSDIALDVMYHFAEKDIPCLCIHDSFIIEEQYEEELYKIMKDEYRKTMEVMTFNNISRNTTPPFILHLNAFKNHLPCDSFNVEIKAA